MAARRMEADQPWALSGKRTLRWLAISEYIHLDGLLQHYLPQSSFGFSLSVVCLWVESYHPWMFCKHVQPDLRDFLREFVIFVHSHVQKARQFMKLCRRSQVSKINKTSLQRPLNDAKKGASIIKYHQVSQSSLRDVISGYCPDPWFSHKPSPVVP